MDIARMGPDDLPAVARLYAHFWGETSDVARMRDVLERLRSHPDYAFLVARDSGEVVGAATGIVCHGLYGNGEPFLVVEDFVVDTARRRSGIGAALMAELERIAQECGCTQAILVTEAARSDAVGFYESVGYECAPYRGFKKRLTRG